MILAGLALLAMAGCQPSSRIAVTNPAVQEAALKGEGEVFPMPSFKPSLSPRIRDIYTANCARCHGEKGDGKGPDASRLGIQPANFTDAQYVRSTPPLQFYNAITEGSKNMEAHRVKLTIEDRWALVFFVRFFATSQQDIVQGQDLYRRYCSVCHGLRGLGAFDGPKPTLVQTLNPPPRNFNDFVWMADKPDTRFFTSISDGRPWTAMPAWGGTIPETDRWRLINFLRTFTYDPGF
jgi:mono/diheme cytochrome c family protein